MIFNDVRGWERIHAIMHQERSLEVHHILTHFDLIMCHLCRLCVIDHEDCGLAVLFNIIKGI